MSTERFDSKDIDEVRALIISQIRPGEVVDDIMAGAKHLGQRRADLRNTPPDRLDLEFVLSIFTWWPLKPKAAETVEETLLAVRSRIMDRASSGDFANLDLVVPESTLGLSIEELYEYQQDDVKSFLRLPDDWWPPISESRQTALYQLFSQLVSQETDYLNARTNIFLVMNSLFFAGFFLFITSDLVLEHLKNGSGLEGGKPVLVFSYAIPAAGMFWSLLQIVITLRNRHEQLRWRSLALSLERMMNLPPSLGIFSRQGIPSWSKSLRNEKGGLHFSKRVAALIWRTATAPNVILGIIMPMIFFSVWTIAIWWMVWAIPDFIVAPQIEPIANPAS